MSNKSITIVVVAIFLHFLWFHLDSNPSLFIYDAILTLQSGTSTLPSTKNEPTTKQRRIIHANNDIEGKTIWITGASSGLGAELAKQLALAGAGHLILSGRMVDKLELVAEECKSLSKTRKRHDHDRHVEINEVKVSLVPFDMSSSEVLDQAVTSAIHYANPSGIDILILNSGQYQCSPALETDISTALPHLLQVNFESPVILSQKLIHSNSWKERGHGHLVVVSSLMGRGASPLNALYASTKHALRGYYSSLAVEEEWLRVDLVLPGATDTGLWRGVWSGDGGRSDALATAIPNATELHADNRSKMSVERCAQLIISGMLGPHAFFFEIWITTNPGLLWVYLASYEPMSFQLMTNIIAPLRIGLFRKNGEDALYLPTLLGFAWECFWGRFS